MIAALRKYRSLLFTFFLFATVLLLAQCVEQKKEDENMRGAGFAGVDACKSCHANIYNDYINTAHFQTSSPASAENIKGNFDSGRNVFAYSEHLKVVMEKKANGLYQSGWKDGASVGSHPFDIVVGSGRKAQTYLYHDSNKIYQLPISYFVPEQTWANSPGYGFNEIKFDRSIPSTCFGCHASAIQVNRSFDGMQLKEDFEKGKMIYGIDCERCHGPAAAHVDFHKENPQEKQSKFIAKVIGLNRRQQVDMCALCHSGLKEMQRPAFEFQPGDSLSKFIYPDFKRDDPSKMDVHGNQSQLMKASKCFLNSNALTCNSCHNVHKTERENLTILSQRCINCHQAVPHTFSKEVDENIVRTNCIDCHMPLQASSAITLLTNQKQAASPDSIRTHLVKLYPQTTDKILSLMKKAAATTRH